MAQTQSVQEHLAAMSDEIKAAAKKTDTEARAKINAALQHAQKAQADMQARGSAGSSETMKHLDELTKNAKQALSESGNELHARIDTMITNAKHAVDAGSKA
jgi:ElaB/YqjD/DUF883 family membrane-anchored ribosome-binding protein